MNIRTKRIYDPPDAEDGIRVLVDRLWPRGVQKDGAHVDFWAKELAPSTELRKWFGHDGAKFTEFRSRYLWELEGKQEAIQELLVAAEEQTLTLLFAARDRSCNHASVLRDFLSDI